MEQGTTAKKLPSTTGTIERNATSSRGERAAAMRAFRNARLARWTAAAALTVVQKRIGAVSRSMQLAARSGIEAGRNHAKRQLWFN